MCQFTLKSKSPDYKRDAFADKIKHPNLSYRPQPAIQRMASLANGGKDLQVGGHDTAITLGDNTSTTGHNCVFIEGCDGISQGQSGEPEIKHWSYVVHFKPDRDDYGLWQKLWGVPGTVERSTRDDYYRSDANFQQEGALTGQSFDPPGRNGPIYFNSHYQRHANFIISRVAAVAATNAAEADLQNSPQYRLRGNLPGYNCATWAAKIMRSAGIQVANSIIPHTVTKSARNIADDPAHHGVYHEEEA